MSEVDQIRAEIHAVLRRYAQECDVTVCQILGVIEIVKADLIQMATDPSRDDEPPHRHD